MKGSVYQRGTKWYYKFRRPRAGSSTGTYPWITKGGFDTEREAWKACRDAMREADRGRVVKPSTRTVARFLPEWLAAIEPSIDATTWQNWKDYARTYVIPHIGGRAPSKARRTPTLEALREVARRRTGQARPQQRDVRLLVGPSRQGRKPHGS